MAKLEPLEGLLLVILGGFSALFLISTWENNPTAALFPRWDALAALILLLATVAVQLRGAPNPRPEPTDDEFPQVATTISHWPSVLALQAAYICAIYLFGFTVATLLYLVSAPLQLGYRRWLIIATQAVLLTLAIAGAFTGFFHVRLPKGILWSWF